MRFETRLAGGPVGNGRRLVRRGLAGFPVKASSVGVGGGVGRGHRVHEFVSRRRDGERRRGGGGRSRALERLHEVGEKALTRVGGGTERLGLFQSRGGLLAGRMVAVVSLDFSGGLRLAELRGLVWT